MCLVQCTQPAHASDIYSQLIPPESSADMNTLVRNLPFKPPQPCPDFQHGLSTLRQGPVLSGWELAFRNFGPKFAQMVLWP